MRAICVAATAVAVLSTAPSSLSAQAPGVGVVSFPNSGAAEAQQDFLTGLAQLHNFEYGPAAALFRKAQERDPGFAMAYWGEAMTYTHPIWMEQDLAAARAVLTRLAPTPATRLAKAATDREKDYLRAIEILYGDGDKESRDIAYASAMMALRDTYPDDVEATVLAALSLLGTSHQGRDFAIYMRAAAMLEPLFPSHPKHPGIAHYLIHSYDDPIHAPLGLRAAREYSKIAPDAAHAQHMCSHIFVAMGMWDDVVEANEAAVRVSGKVAAPNRPPAACGHYPFWLMYGYLQQGRVGPATTMMKQCHAVSAPSPSGFVTLRSRYLIDTEDWTGEVAALSLPLAQPGAVLTHEFVTAFGAIRRGDLAAARAAHAKLQASRRALEGQSANAGAAHAGMPGMSMPAGDVGPLGRARILDEEIAAMLRFAEGSADEAIAMLRKTAAFEETLPFEFGPPFIDKPTYELLGELLLAHNQPAAARAAFEKALSRTPERTAALSGLMIAAAKSGDVRKEAEVRARLDKIRHRADRRPVTR